MGDTANSVRLDETLHHRLNSSSLAECLDKYAKVPCACKVMRSSEMFRNYTIDRVCVIVRDVST